MEKIKVLVTDTHCDEFNKIYKVDDVYEVEKRVFNDLEGMGFVKKVDESNNDLELKEKDTKVSKKESKTKELK